jgi:hypothetical protein
MSACTPAESKRGRVLIARGLHLRSLRLGISGIADVVEFHPDPAGIALAGRGGTWRPFPVEYKRASANESHPTWSSSALKQCVWKRCFRRRSRRARCFTA